MPLNNLDISKYRFTLQAKNKITLPVYKGSAFHGGFGHALKAISPTWFQYFYQPGQGKNGDWPKPFVMLPPLDDKESYQPGEQFHCELTLFGEATQHYSICQAAMEYLGGVMGLGYDQGKYLVMDIIELHPIRMTHTHDTREITLHLPTRLRLKNDNRLQKKAPEFSLLISRLLGRLKTLQLTYSETENSTEYQHHIIGQARNIKVGNSHIHWDDWDRFSGRQKSWMKFGGLTGQISYTGNLQPFMEYLRLGEWIHIGGKTSFGLGKYKLNQQGEIV